VSVDTEYDDDDVFHDDGIHDVGRRRRWPLIVFGVVIVLVAVIALGASWVNGQVNPSGPPGAEIHVTIPPGQSTSAIAKILQDRDVIGSATVFRYYARFTGAGDLKAGEFNFRHNQHLAAVIKVLQKGGQARNDRVTIPEGSSQNQTLALIAKGTEVPLADLKAAAGNPSALGLPAYAQGHLEGFLFPATYDIEPGTSAVQVLTLMIERFQQAADSAGLVQRSQALGLTPYQVVIVASLIERESRLEDEYPKVARVVYNRLQKKMTLGIDASILYGLGRTSGGLKQSELAKDTPYNTRLHPGLPPTPIASPGDKALQAALMPATGDWLYYVLADKSGRQLFTSSYQEFLRQVAKSKAEGVF